MVESRLPTEEGKRRWQSGNGYLKLRTRSAGEPEGLPCTCSRGCPASCAGECGCEACTLAWMVYEDERAIWDESGNLVNPDDLGLLWGRVSDPSQILARYGAWGKASRPGIDD